jgi:hypothetical protein
VSVSLFLLAGAQDDLVWVHRYHLFVESILDPVMRCLQDGHVFENVETPVVNDSIPSIFLGVTRE